MQEDQIAVHILCERLARELDRHADTLAQLERAGMADEFPPDHPHAIERMQSLDHAVQTAEALAGLCHALARSPARGSGTLPTAPIAAIPLSAIRDRLLGSDPQQPREATRTGGVEFF